MGFFAEFKKFAMRGNVMDMAIGIVIGAAFGKIVSTLVANIIMPAIGMVTGGVDLGNLKIVLKDAVTDGEKVVKPAVTIDYGLLMNTIIDFVIIAFAIFLVIKLMNRLQRKQEAAPPAPAAPPRQEVLLEEIRDLLKRKA